MNSNDLNRILLFEYNFINQKIEINTNVIKMESNNEIIFN